MPIVKLAVKDSKLLEQYAARTMSDPMSNPTTGAELGSGLANKKV